MIVGSLPYNVKRIIYIYKIELNLLKDVLHFLEKKA